MNFNQPEWQIVSLEKKHKKNEFDCGNENLNNYLKKYARQNHEKGIAKTFVAISNSKNDLKVSGYYTVSASIAIDWLVRTLILFLIVIPSLRGISERPNQLGDC